jgi:hypothetical protein
VISAPFAAVADGLVDDPGIKDAPSWVRAFRNGASPLFEFASPEAVWHAWEAPVAVGLALASLGVAVVYRRARAVSASAAAAGAIVALVPLMAMVLGALLEATSSLHASALLANVGIGAYFLGTPLAILATSIAGVLALRARVLGRGPAWALILAPAAVVAFVFVVPHLPAGQAAPLAIVWATAAASAPPSRPRDVDT